MKVSVLHWAIAALWYPEWERTCVTLTPCYIFTRLNVVYIQHKYYQVGVTISGTGINLGWFHLSVNLLLHKFRCTTVGCLQCHIVPVYGAWNIPLSDLEYTQSMFYLGPESDLTFRSSVFTSTHLDDYKEYNAHAQITRHCTFPV